MDFLTAPLRNTLTQAPPLPSPAPTDNSDATSFSTFTTTETSSTGVESTHSRFARLRTFVASAAREEGAEELVDEEPIEAPSLRKGDWRAFSKVECRVLVLRDGESGGWKREGARGEEWVLSGTLWITKANSIFFVVDPSVPLRTEPASLGVALSKSAFASIARRLSNRSPSPTEERPRSPGVPFGRRATGDGKALQRETTIWPNDVPDGGSGRSIFATVRGWFGGWFGGGAGATSDGAGGGLALSRTLTRTVETSKTASSKASKKDPNPPTELPSPIRPALPSPLPTCQGRQITALSLHSPSTSIASLRFLPSRRCRSGSSSTSTSPPLSRTVSREPEGPPTINFAQAPDTLPPRLEMDVVAPSPVSEGEGEDGEYEERPEGEAREVIVGFCFVEPLMAQEAYEFRRRVEELSGKVAVVTK